MNRVIGIIPARKGSKRVNDKNFRDFAGKPLFSWVMEAALQASTLSDIALSTDHKGIIDFATLHYDKVICIERPEKFSTDDSPAMDYVNHTLGHFLEKYKKSFDAVVILQPSSPFTLAEDIDNTVNLLLKSGAETAVTVVKLDHMVHPVKMKTMGDQNRLHSFLEEENGRMSAGELPEIYVRNCSVYATRMETIRKNQVIGADCRGYIMPRERSMDINEMIDFDFAEYMALKRRPVTK